MVDFNDRRAGGVHSTTYGTVDSPDERKAYTQAYQAGWRHSGSANASLDNVPQHKGDLHSNAWEDGYMDNAVGRDKFALRGHRFGTGNPVEGY